MAFDEDYVRPKIFIDGFEHGASAWLDAGVTTTAGINGYTSNTRTGYGKAAIVGGATSHRVYINGAIPIDNDFEIMSVTNVPEIEYGRVSFYGKNIDRVVIENRTTVSVFPTWEVNLATGIAYKNIGNIDEELALSALDGDLTVGWHHYEFFWKIGRYSDYYDHSAGDIGGTFGVWVDGQRLLYHQHDVWQEIIDASGYPPVYGNNLELLRPTAMRVYRNSNASADCYIDDMAVAFFGKRTYPRGAAHPDDWYENNDLLYKRIREVQVKSYPITAQDSTGGDAGFLPVDLFFDAATLSADDPIDAIEATPLYNDFGDHYEIYELQTGLIINPTYIDGIGAESVPAGAESDWMGTGSPTSPGVPFAAGISARVSAESNGGVRFRFRIRAAADTPNTQRGCPQEITASAGIGYSSMVFGDGFVIARQGPVGNRDSWTAAKIANSKYGFERVNINYAPSESEWMIVESAWISVAHYIIDPPKTTVQSQVIG
jgi:hypothetical protein